MTAITYRTDVNGLTADLLRGGFFQGWPKPPSAETHLRILESSDYRATAIDDLGQIVGFATAISDHVLTAYISLLEVLPEKRGQGIGTTLIDRLTHEIEPSTASTCCATPSWRTSMVNSDSTSRPACTAGITRCR